ncbi:MAG: signal peptidase I [Actinomycetota bacterium]
MRRERARYWMVVGSLAAAIYGFGNLYQPTVVVGESMAPTLRDGRVIWIDRTYYRSHSPRCGDVVVFRDEVGETYVKRVYRGPGELVRYIASGGQFLVPVREPFYETLKARYEGGRTSLRLDELRVPDDSVFVLGDNFSASVDSRQLGAIPISSILGRAHLDASPSKALNFEFVPHPARREARGEQSAPPATPELPVGPIHPSQVRDKEDAGRAPHGTAPYQISQR